MNTNEIFEMIVHHLREVVPELEGTAITPQDRMADLGANSIDRAEVLMMAMESMSLQIPRVELSGAGNIGELADLLYEKFRTA